MLLEVGGKCGLRNVVAVGAKIKMLEYPIS